MTMKNEKIENIEELKQIAKKIRQGIIESVYSGKSGHPVVHYQ